MTHSEQAIRGGWHQVITVFPESLTTVAYRYESGEWWIPDPQFNEASLVGADIAPLYSQAEVDELVDRGRASVQAERHHLAKGDTTDRAEMAKTIFLNIAFEANDLKWEAFLFNGLCGIYFDAADAILALPSSPLVSTRDAVARVIAETYNSTVTDARASTTPENWFPEVDALFDSGVLVERGESDAQALEAAADATYSNAETIGYFIPEVCEHLLARAAQSRKKGQNA